MQATALPLKDIHIPAAIGWWPPAIGWWLLALLIPILIGLGFWLYKRITRVSALKSAQILLADIKLKANQDRSQTLKDLSVLLRRVAISISPRADVASLTGTNWLGFLDETAKGTAFQTGVGRLLADAPYQQSAPTEAEISQLIGLCEDWLKNCAKRKP